MQTAQGSPPLPSLARLSASSSLTSLDTGPTPRPWGHRWDRENGRAGRRKELPQKGLEMGCARAVSQAVTSAG